MGSAWEEGVGAGDLHPVLDLARRSGKTPSMCSSFQTAAPKGARRLQ